MAWPKGVKRGPKQSLMQEPDTTSAAPATASPGPVAPPPPAPLPPSYEPVEVNAVLVNGETCAFRASKFSQDNGRWTFISYPEQRGFKTVRVLRTDQVAILEVTAPEEMCEEFNRRPAPISALPTMPDSVGGAMVPASTAPIVYGPPLQRPPYDGGDPRRFVRDTRAEQATNVPNAPGIPIAQLSKGEDGVPEVVRASMG